MVLLFESATMIQISHGSDEGLTELCEVTFMGDGFPFEQVGLQTLDAINQINNWIRKSKQEFGSWFSDVAKKGQLFLYKDGKCVVIRLMADLTPEESTQIQHLKSTLAAEPVGQ